MRNNSCSRCGSLNLIADRALAGRIICANCGTPISNNSFGNKNLRVNVKHFNKRIIIFIMIFIFVLIII